ncbi:MAG: hypothetical protein ABFS22_07420 [Pseudomonadota bacterium]
MEKSHLLGAVCAFTLFLLANSAYAAVINPILGLDIGGTLYDVTFHDAEGDSFNALWDADDDGVFGGGASVFSAAPTFWGDAVGASLAAQAIIARLGVTDESAFGGDGFIVPYEAFGGPFAPGFQQISAYADLNSLPGVDTVVVTVIADSADPTVEGFPYASFQRVVVPVPAAVWLFASGLLGLIGISRKKKSA